MSAEQPAAKAFSRSSAPTAVAPSPSAEACPAAEAVLTGPSRRRPTTTMARIDPTKRAVGSRKALAESTTPRRFTAVTRSSTPRQIQTRSPYSSGKADVRAATPAVTETATFST